MPGLVLYAQVDGGFSCWDPARNYWRGENPNRESAYRFKPDEIWDGLPLDEPDKLCNGLITDWGYWQLENGEPFKQLMRVLKALSPSEDEPLQPGALISKVSMEDSRKHPSIRMSYGQQVPLIHASAGIRRVVALAYLLVWVWQEHVDACALQGVEPAREIIFLIDEIEAHLHPQWQRRIVPALLEVMEALTGDHQVPVQLIAATHSPLIMASAEPEFDEASDGVYHLDLTDGAVTLKDVAWSSKATLSTGWYLRCSVCGRGVLWRRSERSRRQRPGCGATRTNCPRDCGRNAPFRLNWSGCWPDMIRSGPDGKQTLRSDQMLDPFEIGDGWFEIILPSLQLRVSSTVPAPLKAIAEFVVKRLHLRDDERVIRQRRAWYELYEAGKLNLKGLHDMAPLIAAAVERQQSDTDAGEQA